MALNIKDMRSKAEAGSCVAQGVLGACFLYGIEVEIDCSAVAQARVQSGSSTWSAAPIRGGSRPPELRCARPSA